jgi:hypothetical protein
MPVVKIHVLEGNTTKLVWSRCLARFKMGA